MAMFYVADSHDEGALDDADETDTVELVTSLGIVERIPRTCATQIWFSGVPVEWRDTPRNACIASRPSHPDDSREWHRDGSGIYECPWVIVWSDVYPTELKLPDDTVTRGKPGEFILFDNRKVLHRMPLDYVQAVNNGTAVPRRFIRAQLGKTPSVFEVERWRRQVDHLRETVTHIPDW